MDEPIGVDCSHICVATLIGKLSIFNIHCRGIRKVGITHLLPHRGIGKRQFTLHFRNLQRVRARRAKIIIIFSKRSGNSGGTGFVNRHHTHIGYGSHTLITASISNNSILRTICEGSRSRNRRHIKSKSLTHGFIINFLPKTQRSVTLTLRALILKFHRHEVEHNLFIARILSIYLNYQILRKFCYGFFLTHCIAHISGCRGAWRSSG